MNWSLLRILIFILLKCSTTKPIIVVALEETPTPRLIVAASHTALSGDLGVLIIELPSAYRSSKPDSSTVATTEDIDVVMDLEDDNDDYSTENMHISLKDPFVLRVLRLDGFTSELVGEVPVDVPNIAGVNVSLMIPCGFFSRGGTYSLQLQHKSSPVPNRFTDIASLHDQQMRTTLDVRWPTPSLALEPQHFDTYPSQPVLATVEYTGISCSPSVGVPVPIYTVQLIYCGTSVFSCDPRNRSHVQMLYTEEVKGFPAQKVITLRCEFFGLAGHYAFRLKPSDANPSAPTTSAYIKVEWSDLFVFNVHARSVYPCDGGGGGVSVLFEYPACRLQGDRVRVYGRLRADVESLAPPSSLHYVAELKAPTGIHTLTFDCDLFTERYVEYCFVYISQAYNGAMSEVRVDCIPTFPIQEGYAGGWGQWSQWTPCSSSCIGGTRTRHRFCDTPPPRYGAKFCQGERVETEACGGSVQVDLRGTWSPGDWECRHGEGLAADRPEVTAEVGNKCRCGCSLDIDLEDHRKILAASSLICPGRSFWLIQTKPNHVVKLHLDQARFPCQGQYVRIRDGDSLIDELLADIGPGKKEPITGQIVSTGYRMLFEFYSEEGLSSADRGDCHAGFLAHLAVALKPLKENGTTSSPPAYLNPKVMAASRRWSLWLTPAHLAAACLLIFTFLVSVFLALQYVFKYRKYQIAEDLDSLTDNSACSGSMQGLAKRARAMSSSTLISEVVSLVRLPRRITKQHARLEETSADIEEGYESTESQSDCDNEEEDEDGDVMKKRCRGLRRQKEKNSSQTTVAPDINALESSIRPSSESSDSIKTTIPSPVADAGSVSATGSAEVKYARPVKLRTYAPISPLSEEEAAAAAAATTSAATTSAATSAATSATEASRLEDRRQFSSGSASTSLNNGFSPASSSSNSTLRRYSGKESKDRRNRERLLQGPGSEFSLANPDLDLELDYYDYNVVNAGAAPGSYLGMDPAFLVWIPPLSENEIDLATEQDDFRFDDVPGCSSYLDTEGMALSPTEYNKVRESCAEDPVKNDREDIIRPRKLDPGECRLHDKIIMEYKTRLSEGVLPIHKILEESSRVKIQGDDSLSCTSDIIPNRLDSKKKSLVGERERLPRKTRKAGRHSKTQNNYTKVMLNSASSTQSLNAKGRYGDLQDPDRDYCEVNISDSDVSSVVVNISRRNQDIVTLNDRLRDETDKKIQDNIVNIPLVELSRDRMESPINADERSFISKRHVNIRSSNYAFSIDNGIEKDDDSIKFADDDDDEYIDNKVTK